MSGIHGYLWLVAGRILIFVERVMNTFYLLGLAALAGGVAGGLGLPFRAQVVAATMRPHELCVSPSPSAQA